MPDITPHITLVHTPGSAYWELSKIRRPNQPWDQQSSSICTEKVPDECVVMVKLKAYLLKSLVDKYISIFIFLSKIIKLC